MGRRKKEPRHVHREHIARAASALFTQKGIAAVSMDDIARAAGYSKATLYVYFKNKEEIVSLLVLESMNMLYHSICQALAQQQTTQARYEEICRSLVRYEEEFPFYFQMLLDHINIDFEGRDYLPEEEETYQTGEEINQKLLVFLQSGMQSGDLRADLEPLPVIFHFWGMLSGLILLASKKEDYINRTMGLSKTEFLEHGFQMLYHSIAGREDRR